jgi:hypothetical protein
MVKGTGDLLTSKHDVADALGMSRHECEHARAVSGPLAVAPERPRLRQGQRPLAGAASRRARLVAVRAQAGDPPPRSPPVRPGRAARAPEHPGAGGEGRCTGAIFRDWGWVLRTEDGADQEPAGTGT